MSINLVHGPRTREGRPIIQPVVVRDGQWHYWHGVGDTSTTLRGGTKFKTNMNTNGTADAVEWRYRDPVWMAGGELRYNGAEFGDHVSFIIYAPATPVTPNGSNEGNCNLVFPGIIVPANGDGEYDVDLDDAYPVPAPGKTGFWNYVIPSDYKFSGEVVSSSPGEGYYHLIGARQNLVRFVAEEYILGSGISRYEPENIQATLCLPEWRFECILHNGGSVETPHNVEIVWRVLVSRVWTTT